jgi:hypothetical protein
VTSNNQAAGKSHSASLTLRQAMWEYACEARWPIFFMSLFFFLSAQCSRHVGLCATRCCARTQVLQA